MLRDGSGRKRLDEKRKRAKNKKKKNAFIRDKQEAVAWQTNDIL